MQGSDRRRAITRNRVAAGSVWETRMRMDEVKGGIKVFNGEESNDGNGDEGSPRVQRTLRRNQSDGGSTERRKRKNWRQPDISPANVPPICKSPIQLRKARSELSNSIRMSDGNCRGFGGGEDKGVLSGGIGEKGVLLIGNGCKGGGGGDEAEIETEAERNSSFDDKEIDLPVEKPKNVDEEKKIHQIHEIPVSPDVMKNPARVIYHRKIDPIPANSPPVEKPKNVDEEKRIHQIHEIPVSPDVEKKPARLIYHRKIDPIPANPPPVEAFETTSIAHDQMQNIVDLVNWRDVSRSAFVFGLGTFILVSSSYARDLNFSLISSISYLGLVYLAAIFLYKSIIRRGGDAGSDERDERRHMVGEEEAIWLLRLLLPYINEMLLKIRALFSGDPETTMKLAVLLFVMARCGSSLTIWTLAKLVFFGVFTIPKVCSSYSAQLARHGKFWLERFRDGWESCTHKKAVAAAIFTVVWNLSSIVARVWAVFMLVVAVRYYQQRGMEGWSIEEEEEEETVVGEIQEDSIVAGPVCHRQRVGPTVLVVGREVKIKGGNK